MSYEMEVPVLHSQSAYRFTVRNYYHIKEGYLDAISGTKERLGLFLWGLFLSYLQVLVVDGNSDSF